MLYSNILPKGSALASFVRKEVTSCLVQGTNLNFSLNLAHIVIQDRLLIQELESDNR